MKPVHTFGWAYLHFNMQLKSGTFFTFVGQDREALNRFWFADLDHARQRLDDWIIEYNRFRPHKALGYLSPDLFAQKLSENQLNAVA